MLELLIKGDVDPVTGHASYFRALIDRQSQTARLVDYTPDMLETAAQHLKALGVEAVEAELTPATRQALEAVGFTDQVLYARRVLNGKVNAKRTLSSMPTD